MPKGAIVRGILESFIKDELIKRGYQPVYTPHIGKIELYQTSGHYPYYKESQFPTLKMPSNSAAKELLDGLISGKSRRRRPASAAGQGGHSRTPARTKDTPEGREIAAALRSRIFEMSTPERIGYLEQTCDLEEYLLKPMNCPHHIQIYAAQPRSYRELPVRLAEFGTVYRYEQSGELSGLTRVRGFTQDDAHLFCTHEQVRGEFRTTLEMTQFFLNSCLGLSDYRVRLSKSDPNDPKYQGAAGDIWRRAEEDIRSVLDEMKLPYEEAAGEAAFYGPKADFIVKDCIGRPWQLGTVQLDYVLPERFGLEYIGPDNQPHRPVMIHRAPLGSMERFMGILIEHFAGAFPLWLAPEQVRVLPISDKVADYSRQVLARLLRRRLSGDARPACREDRSQDPRCPAREDPGDAGRRCQGSREPGGLVPRPGRAAIRGRCRWTRPWRGSIAERDSRKSRDRRRPRRRPGSRKRRRTYVLMRTVTWLIVKLRAARDRARCGSAADAGDGDRTCKPAPELPTVPIDVNTIRLAAERLAPWAHRTPVMTSKSLDVSVRMLGVSQVRELSEGRRVQVPGCDERDPAARRGRAAARRDHAFLGKSWPGGGSGRPSAVTSR